MKSLTGVDLLFVMLLSGCPVACGGRTCLTLGAEHDATCGPSLDSLSCADTSCRSTDDRCGLAQDCRLRTACDGVFCKAWEFCYAGRCRPRGAGNGVMAVNAESACFLQEGGEVICWGARPPGVPGVEEPEYVCPPKKTLFPAATFVASSYAMHSHNACVVDQEGVVWCAGDNQWGQLGTGQCGEWGEWQNEPVKVMVLSGIRSREVAVGDGFACALAETGKVYCWGRNDSGQLGSGEGAVPDPCKVSSVEPVPLEGKGLMLATSPAMDGVDSACALTEDGLVWCWGSQVPLEDGSLGLAWKPLAVGGIPGALAIAVGNGAGCGLVPDAGCFCWGGNYHGLLGPPDSMLESAAAVPIYGTQETVGVSIGGPWAGAIRENARVLSWGSFLPWPELSGVAPTAWLPFEVQGVEDVVALSGSELVACVLDSAGKVRCTASSFSCSRVSGGWEEVELE